MTQTPRTITDEAADFGRFAAFAESFSDEVVTRSRVEDVTLPEGAGTMALIRLDNDDPKRPTTLGARSLVEFGQAVAGQLARARAGEIAALGVIGKPGYLVAGADLSAVDRLRSRDQARTLAELGHRAYDLLEDFPVPTFAFINGTALGGGLEIALAAHHRTVSSGAKALGLPETFLGLIPGWGGIWRLPRLIGPEAAARVIFTDALNGNRSLKGPQAHELGIADALFDAETFEADSLAWASAIVRGEAAALEERAAHRTHDSSDEAWDRALDAARATVAAKTGESAPAPLRALEEFSAGRGRDRDAECEAQCDALADLMLTDEFSHTVYAFLDLVQRRAKRPAGVPEAAPRTITKVGVVGAGLMAAQLAMVFAQHLQVPVVISDLDQDRVDRGLEHIRSQTDRLAAKGRLSQDQADALAGLITGSTDKSVYADADFVIEAVFEEIGVKKQVFAELEDIVADDAVLATNTSSLSVTEMAADLRRPERVIGFHFFNPVAVMPLVEIARTPQSTDESIATAFDLAARLRKTPVLTKDSTAFVVNRILLRLMGEVQRAFDEGTDAETADTALRPIGLPMSPFTLLAMVGIPVAHHVTESLRASFGDRFYVSPNLQRLIDAQVTEIWSRDDEGRPHISESTRELLTQGTTSMTRDELLTVVQDALAEEIGLMLDEGVVASPKDIDLCLILGTGWPMHRGGITPYLDQVGSSERVNGRRFH